MRDDGSQGDNNSHDPLIQTKRQWSAKYYTEN